MWWPYDLAFICPECKRVTYNELSPLQRVCVLLRSIEKQDFPQRQANIVKIGADLIQNSLDLGWGVAKGAFKVVLCQMEGSSWDDHGMILPLFRESGNNVLSAR